MSKASIELAPVSDRAFAAAVAAMTVSVMSFLVWLVYFNRGMPGHVAATSVVLPQLNAVLNASSAALITVGLIAVKKRRYRLHAALMIAAVVASACFLGSYIYYHLHHGDTRFSGSGWVRPVYFTILISHILLSMVAFPLILTSLFLAASRRLQAHRRVSRYTWAIWMYVSLSGVVIFWLLHV